MKKKIIALFVALAVLTALTGCGGTTKSTDIVPAEATLSEAATYSEAEPATLSEAELATLSEAELATLSEAELATLSEAGELPSEEWTGITEVGKLYLRRTMTPFAADMIVADDSADGSYTQVELCYDGTVAVTNLARHLEFTDDMDMETYLKQAAVGICPYELENFSMVSNAAMTEKLSYPVYTLKWQSNEGEDHVQWTMLAVPTDTTLLTYTFAAPIADAEKYVPVIENVFDSLELIVTDQIPEGLSLSGTWHYLDSPYYLDLGADGRFSVSHFDGTKQFAGTFTQEYDHLRLEEDGGWLYGLLYLTDNGAALTDVSNNGLLIESRPTELAEKITNAEDFYGLWEFQDYFLWVYIYGDGTYQFFDLEGERHEPLPYTVLEDKIVLKNRYGGEEMTLAFAKDGGMLVTGEEDFLFPAELGEDGKPVARLEGLGGDFYYGGSDPGDYGVAYGSDPGDYGYGNWYDEPNPYDSAPNYGSDPGDYGYGNWYDEPNPYDSAPNYGSDPGDYGYGNWYEEGPDPYDGAPTYDEYVPYEYYDVSPYIGYWRYYDYGLMIGVYYDGSFEYLYTNGDAESGYWSMYDGHLVLMNAYGGVMTELWYSGGELVDSTGDWLYATERY